MKRILLLAFAALIVITFVTLLISAYYYIKLSALTIENRTGNTIHSLVALWPDGQVTVFEGPLSHNQKITMQHKSNSEGEIMTLFSFSCGSRAQWYFGNSGGYVVANFGLDNTILIDHFYPLVSQSVLVPPAICHPENAERNTESGGTMSEE